MYRKRYLSLSIRRCFVAISNLSPFSFSFAVTKFVRIGIADKNDSPPYFDRFLYETEIDENADLQSTVLTVNAKDHNDCEYWIPFNSILFI